MPNRFGHADLVTDHRPQAKRTDAARRPWWFMMLPLLLALFCAGALWYNGQSWSLSCDVSKCSLTRSVLGLTTTTATLQLLNVEEARGRLRLVTSEGPVSLPGGYAAHVIAIRDYVSRRETTLNRTYSFHRDPMFWVLVVAPIVITGYAALRVLKRPGSNARTSQQRTDRFLRVIFDVIGIALGLAVGVMFVCLGLYLLGGLVVRATPKHWEDLLAMLLLGVLPVVGGLWFLHGAWRYLRDDLLAQPQEDSSLKKVRRRKRASKT